MNTYFAPSLGDKVVAYLDLLERITSWGDVTAFVGKVDLSEVPLGSTCRSACAVAWSRARASFGEASEFYTPQFNRKLRNTAGTMAYNAAYALIMRPGDFDVLTAPMRSVEHTFKRSRDRRAFARLWN